MNVVSVIDHLVVVAKNLEQGVAHIEKALGVQLAKGGEHVKMGTHNCVLHLGGETYLEVIAPNPAAGLLSRPRWFGMDEPAQQRRTETGPYLATFAAQTSDIEACVAALPEVGTAYDMQRDALRWRITIRDDGGLVHNGAVPTFIQWPPGGHPAPAMPHSGCTLLALEIHHPQPQAVEELWRRAGLRQDERLRIRAAEYETLPGLTAHIATPSGVVILR